MPQTRKYRFIAEYTSSLGQYGTKGSLAKDYAEAYAKAWLYIEGRPTWAIGSVAPAGTVEPPLGGTYHAVIRALREKGAFRYRR